MDDRFDNEDDSAETTGATETAVSAPPEADRDSLEELRREKDAIRERLLRTAAEFDNYRKRVDRERRDQVAAAMADAVADLLPVIDDLERALETPAEPGTEAYRRGVELIHQQMMELLRKRGVTPIEAVGADFDPRYHQAIVQEASPDHREGEVMAELRRGYLLRDRLLRPAMVKVAKA